MSDIKKQIAEAVSKRLREEKEYLFKIDSSDVKTFEEFFEAHEQDEYAWEDDLEELLYEADTLNEDRQDGKAYKVGDIIMTTRFMSKGRYIESSPHRVLVITAKEEQDGGHTYRGFILSSQVGKSNKAGRYPNNIYINDYSTILYRGPKYEKEAIIVVDNIVTFTDEDLSSSGTWKGKATYEFMDFVQMCYNNYRRNVSNADIYWEK